MSDEQAENKSTERKVGDTFDAPREFVRKFISMRADEQRIATFLEILHRPYQEQLNAIQENRRAIWEKWAAANGFDLKKHNLSYNFNEGKITYLGELQSPFMQKFGEMFDDFRKQK